MRLSGDKVAAGAVPVPVSDTLCGLPAALSATLTEALREPVAWGVNVTLMVQFAPVATLVPHVFVWLKSPLLAPATVILLIVSDALPVLVSVTACALLAVPTSWEL